MLQHIKGRKSSEWGSMWYMTEDGTSCLICQEQVEKTLGSKPEEICLTISNSKLAETSVPMEVVKYYYKEGNPDYQIRLKDECGEVHYTSCKLRDMVTPFYGRVIYLTASERMGDKWFTLGRLDVKH